MINGRRACVGTPKWFDHGCGMTNNLRGNEIKSIRYFVIYNKISKIWHTITGVLRIFRSLDLIESVKPNHHRHPEADQMSSQTQ